MTRKWMILYVIFIFLLLASCSNDSSEDGSDGDSDVDSVAGDSDREWEDIGRLVDLVDPFIGTGGTGFGIGAAVPGAKAPFGMIFPSPDTTGENGQFGFYHCGGYYDPDPMIEGFSHTHLHGVGAQEYGNLMFVPLAGSMSDERTKVENYRSTYSKDTQTASPGYYAVTLDNGEIRVELTATERAAHHRYTYPAEETTSVGTVFIDVSQVLTDGEVIDSEVTVDTVNKRVEGWLLNDHGFSGRYGGITIYFSIRYKQDTTAWGTTLNGFLKPEISEQEGDRLGVYLEFDTSGGAEIELQAAISFVSVEKARLNLETEMPDWDFDGTRAQTEQMWENELSVVKFRGGTQEQQVIMATALYHAFLMPDLFMDVDGSYRGFDLETHIAEDFEYYTDFSMWDTYRTLHPLLSLVRRERQADMLQSLVKMARQGGSLPKWPMGVGYTDCMIGSPADIVIADSYVKGIRDFDVEDAYEFMLEHAEGPVAKAGREDVESYNKYGYCTVDTTGGSVSKTMEHAIADFAISQMAEALGKTEDAELYAEHSLRYRNLWDAENGFFTARHEDGSMVVDYDFLEWEDFYTEGNSWQYLWLAPHDPFGLRDLFGSDDAMREKLEEFFENAATERENWNSLNDLLPPAYYWHGNEPDIHAPYLFLYVSRPDLTQKWMHWIAEELYSTQPDGIAGNDDCGTLSAWYVFSSLGFYPLAGSDTYWIGSPIFPYAELDMGDGATLIVEAPEASEENIYVQSVTLNGEALDLPWFTHADIAQGGRLVFEMGPQPSDWGKLSK